MVLERIRAALAILASGELPEEYDDPEPDEIKIDEERMIAIWKIAVLTHKPIEHWLNVGADYVIKTHWDKVQYYDKVYKGREINEINFVKKYLGTLKRGQIGGGGNNAE